MAEIRKNDAGILLGDARVELKSPEYGTGKYNGVFPDVRWNDYRKDCADEDGFDIRHVEENGTYCMEVELPRGTQLIRYGSSRGRFTAPKGTPFETLGLPYVRETVEFHEYKVEADSINVICVVKRGVVAPMFDSKGGGVQYLHPSSMQELTGRKHVLSEVFG